MALFFLPNQKSKVLTYSSHISPCLAFTAKFLLWFKPQGPSFCIFCIFCAHKSNHWPTARNPSLLAKFLWKFDLCVHWTKEYPRLRSVVGCRNRAATRLSQNFGNRWGEGGCPSMVQTFCGSLAKSYTGCDANAVSLRNVVKPHWRHNTAICELIFYLVVCSLGIQVHRPDVSSTKICSGNFKFCAKPKNSIFINNNG